MIIQPLPEDWLETLPDLSQVSMIIFVSGPAVQYFFAGLHRLNKKLPKDIRLIAIGQATANKLKTYHQGPIDYPKSPHSEALLELTALKHPQNQEIVLVNGLNSRPLIAQTLSARGANLKEISVYQRLAPKKNLDFNQRLWQDNLIDVLLLMSQEATANIVSLFEGPAKLWLLSKPCFVLSPRIAKAAKAVGFKQIYSTTYPDLLRTIASVANGPSP